MPATDAATTSGAATARPSTNAASAPTTAGVHDGGRTSRFLAWAARRGVCLTGAAVAAGLEPGGRGLIATADLPEGHTLFRVPRATLSPATSPAGAAIAAAAGVTGVPALAVTIVVETARGGASPWAPYLDILPRGDALAHLPLLWSPALHARAGDVLAPAARRRASLTRLYTDRVAAPLAAAVAAAAADAANSIAVTAAAASAPPPATAPSTPGPPGGGSAGEGLLTAFLEAAALVGCNAFDVDAPSGEEVSGGNDAEAGEVEERGSVAMVPAADLLNHRTGWNNARLYVEEDALHMVTIAPVSAGTQLYNTYGLTLNNAGLAAAYGFTNHPNPNPPAVLASAEVTDRLPRRHRASAAGRIRALYARAGLPVMSVANFAVGGRGAFTRPLLEVLGIIDGEGGCCGGTKGGRGGMAEGGCPHRNIARRRRQRDCCGGRRRTRRQNGVGGACSGAPATSTATTASDRAAGLAVLAAAVAARHDAVTAAATAVPWPATTPAAAAAVADDVRAEAARVWAAARRRVAAAAVVAAGSPVAPPV
ncbi:hypothetical protein MMPV_009146 [Pyropia vietnamensis]